ncbi:MAG: hypothetical protein EOO99_02170 [Pedobacter sp.]|nr:MAG: hypothetical protein EOO99_02170 [Pedobacter sp.]
MFLKICITSLLVFSINFCYAQSWLNGSVFSANNEALSNVSIIVRSTTGIETIAYTRSNLEGKFQIQISWPLNADVLLIASSLGYKRDTLKFNFANHDSKQSLIIFHLIPETHILKTVEIKSTPKIQNKNDTTVYQVNRFTSPEDRNLEDVIKKLPGMQVNREGVISFKNKPIQAVLLAGDDLTKSNYQAITQNMKPELVAEIEAIENFVEDDLLRGIINSEDVILNLKMVDDQQGKFLGGISLENGLNAKSQNNLNTIYYKSSYKMFGYLRQNNVGSSQETLYDLSPFEKDFLHENKLINNQIASFNPFNSNELALNKSYSGSYNAVMRLIPKLKINTNIFWVHNKLTDTRESSASYYEPINIRIKDYLENQSRLNNYRGEIDLAYQLSSNRRLTGKFNLQIKPKKFDSQAITNIDDNSNNEVNQKDYSDLTNTLAQLRYTHRKSQTSAIVYSILWGKLSLDQNYEVYSPIYQNLLNNQAAVGLRQNLTNINHNLSADIQLLKKISRQYLYFNTGLNLHELKLNTSLLEMGLNKQSNDNSFINADKFQKREAFLNSKFALPLKNQTFQFLLRQEVVSLNFNSLKEEFYNLKPEIRWAKRLTQNQGLKINYAYSIKQAEGLRYFTNPILVNFRTFQTGLNTFFNFNRHDLHIAYSNNEWYDSQYLNFNINYKKQWNSKGSINMTRFEDNFFYQELIPYKGLQSSTWNGMVSKFFPILSATIDVQTTFNSTQFYSQVVNDINPYYTLYKNWSLRYSTGFKLPVNFSLYFQWTKNTTDLYASRINKIKENQFSLESRIKWSANWFQKLDFNRYMLNLNSYHFVNTALYYNPSKGAFKYSFTIKNILNENKLSRKFVSDIQETESNAAILGRYALIGIQYSFN